MDISKTIAEMKQDPGFAQNVGMVLAHNGTAREWSRADRSSVTSLKVQPDQEKIERIRQEILQYPGIFDIRIQANEGTFTPGDDLLFLVVAGDIRENVKKALSDLLDRVKTEAISKEEVPGA
ncbi:molybdenum cofactor biosynthesis protein MoaE [Desulfohalobium retbaense]|uniref:Molybdopterin synthase catalytic subunit n=1 Tax=Desulfohalobium retbaense (strain ATCC 49708 / DSM 5692 / JCM 16813 / HR100) TaxID=485915 RepID=C8X3M7_DESRD|nr:molybdenum cofactor biosynthesis protein MoaE [Desulfohalobium retbaense]ACV69024.1 conserved hypothetical protein [Desulfohalobium retbaense DSM 5692]